MYLRHNSNISTGGDSIDFTDKIHHDYYLKELLLDCRLIILKINVAKRLVFNRTVRKRLAIDQYP